MAKNEIRMKVTVDEADIDSTLKKSERLRDIVAEIKDMGVNLRYEYVGDVGRVDITPIDSKDKVVSFPHMYANGCESVISTESYEKLKKMIGTVTDYGTK